MDAIPRLHGGREPHTGVCKRTGALVHGKCGVPDDDVLNECSALIGMGYSDEIGAVNYVIDRVCSLDEVWEGIRLVKSRQACFTADEQIRPAIDQRNFLFVCMNCPYQIAEPKIYLTKEAIRRIRCAS